MPQNEVLEKVRFHAKLGGLSKNTEDEYVTKARAFQTYFGKPATELGLEDIQQFLYYLLTERKLCSGSINTYNSGLRFLFQIALDRPLETTKIPCHRKHRTIPNILTKEEVSRLLQSAKNHRDKAILATMYGAGLRLNEVVSLKVSDIDSANMQLLIRDGREFLLVYRTWLLVSGRLIFSIYEFNYDVFEGMHNFDYHVVAYRFVVAILCRSVAHNEFCILFFFSQCHDLLCFDKIILSWLKKTY